MSAIEHTNPKTLLSTESKVNYEFYLHISIKQYMIRDIYFAHHDRDKKFAWTCRNCYLQSRKEFTISEFSL